ncbi:hypothetical protein A2129_02380 [Candidatus Woesebacteria bacterium GWC1_42_13]|uniref:Uncharacterized protein n=1 Tax=Candidatus Woesebacteria bacterium GWC1_42_13 TaxID=1802475 RepID=A0A1F7WXX1_9BACT|nr:MAG: hypothetical protein A2129_02380 [Candidatus Woesebacteria bacterium GWC1_42_13]
METFGAPEGYPSGITAGPYGVFGASEDVSGVVSLGSGSVRGYFSGDWAKLESGKSQNLGIFVLTSE